MALSAWQQSLFVHRFTIYRYDRNTKQHEPVATSVPGYFQTAPNLPNPVGFNQATSTETNGKDTLHCHGDTDLKKGDVVKMATGDDAGSFWDVFANPQRRSLVDDNQAVQLQRRDAAPDGAS